MNEEPFKCVECGELVATPGVKVHKECLLRLWLIEAESYNLRRRDILEYLLRKWLNS